MSRGIRLVAGLAGAALVCAVAAPPARAQRCPFQMQMWYQVQMQQYSFHAQQIQSQHFASPTAIGGGTGFQSHALEPSTFRSMGVSLRPEMRFSEFTHQSLSSRTYTLAGHPFGEGDGPGGRPFMSHRIETRVTTTTVMRPELHPRLTTEFREMTGRKLLESGRFVSHQTMVMRPETMTRGRAIEYAAQRPVVRVGLRMSCMGGCHFHQGQPMDVLRTMPQQPANPLLVQFLRMQRPPPAPGRVLPAPDPFLVQLRQRAFQPGLPARTAVPAGMPPWLRALEAPPALPPALVSDKPVGPGSDPMRAAVPDESSSPGAAAAALPPQGLVRIEPFSPDRVEGPAAPPDPVRVVSAPPLPASEGTGSQSLWPAPTIVAVPEADRATAAAPGPSPDAVLEAPTLPPSPSAILPPQPLEDILARLPAESGETDPVLLPPPLPSRSRSSE